ncbi:response regulator transcription factor [Bacillus sp. 1P06AnD]|uniref:response regulator transcription factor n=1 Tax=Bacillus sp. 1P06AnD TaxID=3132208 RepID=UPI00399F5887
MKRILIIEDEVAISDLLSYSLEKEGFITFLAYTGDQGIKLVRECDPDMIILDLMLPDTSGFEVCKSIVKDSSIPIIMVTAKSDSVDKILGMELGADDYITKPFDIREVIVRVKAIFRRIDLIEESFESESFKTINVGKEVVIYKERREVYKNKTRIDLTNKEYELLLFLAENKGKVFTRANLLDKVWGFDYVGDTRTVDIHIQRLRKKIDDSKNSFVETVFGVGYKIV